MDDLEHEARRALVAAGYSGSLFRAIVESEAVPDVLERLAGASGDDARRVVADYYAAHKATSDDSDPE